MFYNFYLPFFIFGLFNDLNFCVIEWRIYVWYEIWNNVRMWWDMVFSGNEITCWDC